ncbi:MAG: hypothetical protein IPK04_14030 [Bdellovibrionales bacterium]|nr:hypothetical protein [Bdellovibrionales bacterium]MBL7670084.1 hypothetical protein [Pseudobdellovibrionaceae bacterium]
MGFCKFLVMTCLCLAICIQAQADEDVSDTTNKVPVSTGPYITGGILASTIGFGIGHAVQGRWADKGWIFTATESLGLVMLSAAASTCSKKTDIYGVEKTECSDTGLALAGLGVLIGFHVWEIVDAWTGATPVEDSGPKVFLLPNPNAPELRVAWNF